jgi:hypothetical protein
LRQTTPSAAKAFRTGDNPKLLEEYKMEAARALVLEHELRDMEPVEVAACLGGDLKGNFNFRRKLTRKYFEQF